MATTSKNSFSLKYFLSDLDFFGLPSPLSMPLLLQLLVPSRLEGKIQFSELNDYCISFYNTFIFDAVISFCLQIPKVWSAWTFFIQIFGCLLPTLLANVLEMVFVDQWLLFRKVSPNSTLLKFHRLLPMFARCLLWNKRRGSMA